jgi:hypothetical protein
LALNPYYFYTLLNKAPTSQLLPLPPNVKIHP